MTRIINDDQQIRALYESVWRNKPDQFHQLCKQGVDPSTVYANQRTLMHVAAWFGHAEFIAPLNDTNAALKAAEDNTGCTPIMLAAKAGQMPSFKALVNIASPLTQRSSMTSQALAHILVAFHRLDEMIWLDSVTKDEDRHVLWTVTDADGNTPAHIAARQGQQKVLSWLYARGASKTDCNALGQTVLQVLKSR